MSLGAWERRATPWRRAYPQIYSRYTRHLGRTRGLILSPPTQVERCDQLSASLFVALCSDAGGGWSCSCRDAPCRVCSSRSFWSRAALCGSGRTSTSYIMRIDTCSFVPAVQPARSLDITRAAVVKIESACLCAVLGARSKRSCGVFGIGGGVVRVHPPRT